MNYSFFTPRKDQCDRCLGHKNGLIEETIWLNHVREKDLARNCKEADKKLAVENPKTVLVATVDLQQVLLCPKSQSSATYYKRKLAVHNFTVYNLGTSSVDCYMWHEGEGGLEASEFATLLTDYLSTLPETIEIVILWSDGCTYQNRNATISSALLYFLRSNMKPNLKEIHQKYLVRGHTQMEVDSVHATIEQRARHVEVYTPMEWETIMKTARHTKPYNVHSLDHAF